MKLNKILSAILYTLTFFSASAQHHLAGNWLGMLDAGAMKLRLVFHITESSGTLSTTMDSPDQGAKGIPVSQTSQVGDSIVFSLGAALYRGRVLSDSSIDGIWVQGREFPVALHKTNLVNRPRPQTPQPPFPYKSQDVTFTNSDKTITYGATITSPSDTRKHPAILLITGSGQQNRDEEIMEHKPFAVIADYLTRKGYVVMRVDDRGMGQTTGNTANATTADFASDAEVELNFLKKRPEVNPAKLGVLGHSEGGMIATMLAARRKDIAFMVSMAGPGVPNLDVMVNQNDAILEKAGMPSQSRKAYLGLYAAIMKSVTPTSDKAALSTAIESIVSDWRKRTPAVIVEQTTDITDDASQQKFVSTFAGQVSSPWFRYFISYSPTADIEKLSCKVLAINGAKDVQVVAAPNLAGWESSLKKSHSPAFSVRELAGLNHLFQECTRCDVSEYGDLEQTISPAALAAISDWLGKEVGR